MFVIGHYPVSELSAAGLPSGTLRCLLRDAPSHQQHLQLDLPLGTYRSSVKRDRWKWGLNAQLTRRLNGAFGSSPTVVRCCIKHFPSLFVLLYSADQSYTNSATIDKDYFGYASLLGLYLSRPLGGVEFLDFTTSHIPDVPYHREITKRCRVLLYCTDLFCSV